MASADLKAAEKELAQARAATERWKSEQFRRALARGAKTSQQAAASNQFRTDAKYGGTLLQSTTQADIESKYKANVGQKPTQFKGGYVVQKWVPDNKYGFSDNDNGKWVTVSDPRNGYRGGGSFLFAGRGDDALFQNWDDSGPSHETGQWGSDNKWYPNQDDGFYWNRNQPPRGTSTARARRVKVTAESNKSYNKRLEAWQKKSQAAQADASAKAIAEVQARHRQLMKLGEQADRKRLGSQQTAKATTSREQAGGTLLGQQSTKPQETTLLEQANERRVEAETKVGVPTKNRRLGPFRKLTPVGG